MVLHGMVVRGQVGKGSAWKGKVIMAWPGEERHGKGNE
tara:strand:- start:838 stop:951 length:114 start_codon:yes stop_codon:yes gene_type:complete